MLRRTFAVAASLLLALPALAQDYPSKPVTLIVTFAAGGGSDLIGRAFAKELSAKLGQPVVVENRTGATGVVGLDALTRVAPDGYTIMQLANATIAALHFQNRTLEMDKALTAIGNIQLGTTLIAVNPNVVNVKTLLELLAHFKANPGTTYNSSGQGSQGHLLLAGLAMEQKLDITFVNYRGNAPAILDVVGGRVGVILTDSGSLRPHLQSGALRAAASTSSVHAPTAPDVPMSSEQGFRGFVYDPVSAIIAPPGMAPPVLDKLRAAVRDAAQSPGFAAAMKEMGYQNHYTDGPALRAFLIDEYERWGKIIRDSGIKPD
jgi:tripartite-type tricarboxylate transporter receptor subunit TctC